MIKENNKNTEDIKEELEEEDGIEVELNHRLINKIGRLVEKDLNKRQATDSKAFFNNIMSLLYTGASLAKFINMPEDMLLELYTFALDSAGYEYGQLPLPNENLVGAWRNKNVV